MQVFKGDHDKKQIVEVSLKDAIKAVRQFNAEFCHDKSNADLVSIMKWSPIYTNLSQYWIGK